MGSITVRRGAQDKRSSSNSLRLEAEAASYHERATSKTVTISFHIQGTDPATMVGALFLESKTIVILELPTLSEK